MLVGAAGAVAARVVAMAEVVSFMVEMLSNQKSDCRIKRQNKVVPARFEEVEKECVENA